MNTLFSHVTVLCMDEANTVLQDAYVLVKGREIAYVGPVRPQEPAGREVNGTGKVLMPGFVDAHTHLTMSLMRGYAGGHDLQTWLNDYIFPVEAKAGQPGCPGGHGSVPGRGHCLRHHLGVGHVLLLRRYHRRGGQERHQRQYCPGRHGVYRGF